MTTEEAAIVLQVASNIDESGEESLAGVASILRGLLGEVHDRGRDISRLRAQITEMQSNASTSAFDKVNDQLAEANRENANLRAQVATLSAGKAWIPEPTVEECAWIDGRDLCCAEGATVALAWAREHAVAPVAVPELTSQWCDEIWRHAPRGVPVWEAIKWVIEQDRKRIRSIPADRILQDDQVAVDRGYLEATEALTNGWSEFRTQFDDIQYHYEGMGCGIEDRGIHDRYEACKHGWECAMERVSERFPEIDAIDALRAKKEGGQE